MSLLHSRSGITKLQAAVIALVILIAAIAGTVYYITRPPTAPSELPYAGITLVQQACAEPLARPFKMAAEEFEEKTGAKIIIEEVAYGHVHDKVMMEAIGRTGAYDLVHVNPVWASDVVLGGYAIPVNQYITENETYYNEEWLDIIPAFRDAMVKWGENIYGWPMDGDTHALYYRSDLFGDPQEQAAFTAQYGYDLKPPETLDQYLDIAEFFTRDTDGDGVLDFWGTGSNLRREQVHWWFFARYFTLGGKYFFDPETMEPLINGPPAVRALEYLIEASKPTRSPPGVLSWGFTELFAGFYEGRIAMSSPNIWPDMAPMSEDPEKSRIQGKWGIDHVPGTYEIWDYEQEQWVTLSNLFRATPVPHNWMVLIMGTSEHPDVAAEWAKFLTSKEMSKKYVVGPWGADPFRYSHFTDPELRTRFPKADVYLDTLMENLGQNPWFDLRIPGVPEYYDVLAVELSRALAGEITVEAALNTAAIHWDSITDRLGREAQLNAYRATLGLPPK